MSLRAPTMIVYYATTKQRVRIAVDERLIEQTLAAVDLAQRIMVGEIISPPLVNSPKCPRCSLVGVCLPDETRSCATARPDRPDSAAAIRDRAATPPAVFAVDGD